MPTDVVTPASDAPTNGEVAGATREFNFRGVHYAFREITVIENDACIDAALSPDKQTVNNRVMTRMMILKTCTSPAGFGIEDLGKLPYKVYQRMVDLVNELNDADDLEDPNPSPPAG